jgi:hypothetical protein
MQRTRKAAAVLALGIGVACSSAGPAVTALAASGRPVPEAPGQHAPAAQGRLAGLGQFRTWSRAQSAAGFKLARPTRTFGLHRSGLIVVSRCETKGRLGKRNVEAVYGDTPRASLRISQNNSGGLCGVIGRTAKLGRVRVGGAWASLTGLCGRPSLPSCQSTNIFLFLTWKKGAIVYRASAHDEPRRTLVGFARGLVPVR